jgi:hypothetical protein
MRYLLIVNFVVVQVTLRPIQALIQEVVLSPNLVLKLTTKVWQILRLKHSPIHRPTLWPKLMDLVYDSPNLKHCQLLLPPNLQTNHILNNSSFLDLTLSMY